MVIPCTSGGDVTVRSVSRHSASGQRCARIISNKYMLALARFYAGLFILAKEVT